MSMIVHNENRAAEKTAHSEKIKNTKKILLEEISGDHFVAWMLSYIRIQERIYL